jgi:Tfp pilus assembly protein PilE
VRARLRSEQGFGLIELLMAMVMLNVGILAVVAAYNSGIVALHRASRISTASALADAQMELYRALTYDTIGLDGTALSSVDNTYLCDSALGSGCPNSAASETTVTCSGSPLPPQCDPSRIATGADHKQYRVDTYVRLSTSTTTPPTPPNGRPVKIITVVVRNVSALSARPFARLTATFDQSTGLPAA